MIWHLTTPGMWQAALERGHYETGSLQQEGFIHCCLQEQVAGVVARYYQHVTDLIVLHIDESKLSAPVRYELSPAVQELFPHIYGPVNLEAVTAITPYTQ